MNKWTPAKSLTGTWFRSWYNMNVGLFIRDFEIGAKVSTRLTELGATFEFYEKTADLDSNVILVIIDLDDDNTGNEFFVHQLVTDHSELQIIGYLKHVRKENHEKFKMAGCNVILPRSSLVKNLSTFIGQ